MKTFVTNNYNETQKLGDELAHELRGGEVICMTGELGSGKTTFTQGLLKGLGVEGPYTSPTFVIMKEYHVTHNMKHITNIYHIDAYRVGSSDIMDLGWKEIIADKNNVTIVEWAERIEDIIPKDALRIGFEWVDADRRKITFKV